MKEEEMLERNLRNKIWLYVFIIKMVQIIVGFFYKDDGGNCSGNSFVSLIIVIFGVMTEIHLAISGKNIFDTIYQDEGEEFEIDFIYGKKYN